MNIIDDHNAAVPSSIIEATYYVYGTPVLLRCNHEKVRELADASFAGWNVLRRDSLGGQRHVDCAVLVQKAGHVPETPPQYRATAETVALSHGGLVLHASRPKRSGFIQVPQDFLEQRPEDFRRLFLECLMLFLASHTDRVPLHASVALVGERPLLLCGASGSGKSTLLYALLRAGCPILAEESVCVSREGGAALWGLAQEIGLRAGAFGFFPELANAVPSMQPNGRLKHVEPVKPGQRAYPKQCGPFTVAFLTAEAGDAPTEITRDEARARLVADREKGFDLAQDYAEAVDALLVASRCLVIPRAESPLEMLRHLLSQ